MPYCPECKTNKGCGCQMTTTSDGRLICKDCFAKLTNTPPTNNTAIPSSPSSGVIITNISATLNNTNNS